MSYDANRLIYRWIPPNTECPVLVDPRSYGACHTCGQTFRRRPQHCHLCGEMFDDLCTARYHLPPPFANGKSGPVRVCFACRNRCLAWHDQQLGINLTDLRRPLFKSDVVDGVLEIYPPVEWAQADASNQCKTCERKGLKRHHCRACGELYCSDCSSKMIVPDTFDKKHKNGPQRVCNECRYLIMTGAQWSDDNPIEDVRKPFRNLFTLHPVRTAIPRVDESEPSCILRLVWYDNGEVLGQITAGLHWDLDIIDKVVRRLNSVLTREYVYTYRRRPVCVEHWTAFTARDLQPDLVLCAADSFQIRWRVNKTTTMS